MNLLITGDSHLFALREAYQETADAERAPFFNNVLFFRMCSFPAVVKPFFELQDGEPVFTEPTIEGKFLKQFGEPRFAPSVKREAVIVLSMAFTTTLIVRSNMWRLYSPSSIPNPDRMAVSNSVIREIALTHFAHVLSLLNHMKAQGYKLLAIAAPPPRRKEFQGPLIRDLPTVLEVDRLSRSAVSAALDKMNIPVVPPPEQCFEERNRIGFMKAEYGDPKDGIHANKAYGRLMLREIFLAAQNMSLDA